jgi:hypothetical protein
MLGSRVAAGALKRRVHVDDRARGIGDDNRIGRLLHRLHEAGVIRVGPFALADVRDDQLEAPVVEQGNVHLRGEGDALPVHEYLLGEERLSERELGKPDGVRSEMSRLDELGHAVAQELGGGPAHQPLGGRIGLDHAPIPIDHDDREGCLRDERPVVRLTPPQRPGCVLGCREAVPEP